MSLVRPYDFLIQWHLTERCNLRCRHCYQEGGQVRELSRGQIFAVIDEIAEMLQAWRENYDLEFQPSFNVTGGEPFLRPDLFDILERMAGIGFEIYVLTNGTVITGERARRLADLPVNGVQVSLEGPPEIHDFIRGPGSFAASLQGIRALMEAGVKVSLNATLSRLNAGHFRDLVELAVSLGVPRLGFSRLVPSGQGRDLLDQMLSTAQVQELYEEVLSLSIDGLEIVTGDPMAAQMGVATPAESEGESFPAGGCSAGVAGLTILADGVVVPCRRLHLPLGKVGQDSLREIWAASPVLEALRDKSRYGGKCGKCARWADCRGCRAIAYEYARSQGRADFLAPDPQCFIDGVSSEQFFMGL
jgi:MoaA/NifB/PqqE/SkfB family radical SAM enzyme